MVTVVTGSQMIGQLLGGYLGDRFDKRYLSVACMIAHAVALLGLAYAETQRSGPARDGTWAGLGHSRPADGLR